VFGTTVLGTTSPSNSAPKFSRVRMTWSVRRAKRGMATSHSLDDKGTQWRGKELRELGRNGFVNVEDDPSTREQLQDERRRPRLGLHREVDRAIHLHSSYQPQHRKCPCRKTRHGRNRDERYSIASRPASVDGTIDVTWWPAAYRELTASPFESKLCAANCLLRRLQTLSYKVSIKSAAQRLGFLIVVGRGTHRLYLEHQRAGHHCSRFDEQRRGTYQAPRQGRCRAGRGQT
jgi:hypothetical protein